MHTVTVPLPSGAYDILIGRGLLRELPAILADRLPAAHYAVVTDSHVAALYAEPLVAALAAAGCEVTLAAFPAGEPNKTRETWAALTDQLLAAGVGRDGAVVALGGGVAGDLAGFVAATYLRGLRYAQVPTTLLAMVDASIGGKTGVDTPAGKNLVGAFHQPAVVIADIETLRSSRPQHVAAGMAEALKHGAIADERYFGALEAWAPAVERTDLDVLHAVVRRSIEIKAGVVREDERETGRRAILNFGHTIAHAIEATSGYAVLHGEAVAIGMVVEAGLAERLGIARHLRDRLAAAVERYGLPTARPETSADALLNVLQRDKKVRDRTVRFALPAAIGRMARADDGGWTIPVPGAMLREFLAEGR